ncbi:MAG: four helix bundle protein [Candidatus Yanofskybacteria bacterium]|nr:four helix bundle protein [Candidatus Yanofskybacteria bacterium]
MTNDRDKKLFKFLDWEVYKDAQDVFIEVVQIVRKLPQDLRYTLGSQIIRSGLSVILNIAEGSGRLTDKEMSRFFDISLGSINETVAGLDCLLKLDCLEEAIFQRVFQKYKSISRQLGGFKKKLTRDQLQMANNY